MPMPSRRSTAAVIRDGAAATRAVDHGLAPADGRLMWRSRKPLVTMVTDVPGVDRLAYVEADIGKAVDPRHVRHHGNERLRFRHTAQTAFHHGVRRHGDDERIVRRGAVAHTAAACSGASASA